MKTLTRLLESFNMKDENPGNGIECGVANHYTPIENILINVKNLFAVRLSIAAAVAEDGVSLKLSSSKFTTKENTENLLNAYINVYSNCDITMKKYIIDQGLDKMTMVPVGNYYVVYFSPSDIVKDVKEGFECSEQQNLNVEDVEVYSQIFENDDDEEVTDATHDEILEIITGKDLTKAAKELEAVVTKRISLPREFYFAHVKSKNGQESIALRWKYIKRQPGNTSIELVKSIMNIFGPGDSAVWVADFDDNSIEVLPKEVKQLIDTILEILDAEKTDDPCVFSIKGDDSEEKKDEEDSKEGEEDSKDNSEEKKDEEDSKEGEDDGDDNGEEGKEENGEDKKDEEDSSDKLI